MRNILNCCCWFPLLVFSQKKDIDISSTLDTSALKKIVSSFTPLATYILNYQKSVNLVGKAGIMAKDLPQLTQTIDRAVMDRQQVLRISDVLQNTAGIYLMGNTGGYQEEIASRGFALGSSNTFKNGARFNNTMMPELSNAEKVEFLKGGAAILYGNVSPGGIMNIVTKKPQWKKGGELSFRSGSYKLYKTSVDVYGPLAESKRLAYRLNTSLENSRSFRSEVVTRRLYLNPSFLFQINSQLQWLFEWDYLEDQRTPDFGIGAIEYQIPAVHRSTFLNLPWAYNKMKQIQGSSTFTWQIHSNWKLRTVASQQQFLQDLFGAARPNSNGQTIQKDGTWVRGIQRSGVNEKYYLLQSDLTGRFYTGKKLHQLLLGADAEQMITKATSYNTTTYNINSLNTLLRNKNVYDTININNPVQNRMDMPYLSVLRYTRSPIDRFGIYVQDLFSLNSTIKILAGVRFSSQSNLQARVDTVGKSVAGFIAAYHTKALSPKFAMIYQPNDRVSLFASYTNSFTPNSGTDIQNIPLPPSIIDQFELGSKLEILNKFISLNMAMYVIHNSNLVQSVLPVPSSNPNAKELAGSIMSKGFEVDILTKSLHGISVTAGYSFNDTRYLKSNIYAKNDILRYNPKHTAHAHMFYQFDNKNILKGGQIGIGAYYVGTRFGGRNTSILNPAYKLMMLPAYTLVDISLGYQINSLSIRLKLSNVLNKLSYNVHDDNSVNPIAPRQYTFTLLQKI